MTQTRWRSSGRRHIVALEEGACGATYPRAVASACCRHQIGTVSDDDNCDNHTVPSTFRLVTRSHHSAEELFDLSLSVDAHVASMASSEESAVAGVTTGQIGPDEMLTWRARHFGIWFTMTARIIEFERPRRFVDSQVAGPFRSFVHEHDFLIDDDGSTVMIDTFTLASPVLGRLAERAVLIPYLRRLIARRNQHLLGVLDNAA
jgi:ligand-binding SRPBCC domain-containing protein